MFCSKCGKENADSSSFCQGCGNPLHSQSGNLSNQAPQQSPPSPPVKKKTSKLKIVLIVVGIFIGLGIIGNILYLEPKETQQKPELSALNNFKQKADAYLNDIFLKEDDNAVKALLDECNAAIAADTGGDQKYTAYLYATRSFAHAFSGDGKKAIEDGKKSLELDPKGGKKNIFMLGYFLETKDFYKGAQLMEAYAKTIKDSAQKNKHLLMADVIRLNDQEVSPRQLLTAFDDNEVAAEARYKGRKVLLKGKLSSIDTDLTGDPQISFYVDNYGISSVICGFDSDQKKSVAMLKKGQTITIIGTCRGTTLGSVYINKCSIVK